MEENTVCEKVWGCEEILETNELYTGKYLYVQPGYRCSRHRHLIKDETFICVAGSGFISVGDAVKPFSEGCKQRILPGTWHFFGSMDGMTLLEISTMHSDADVERSEESRQISPADHELWNLYHG